MITINQYFHKGNLYKHIQNGQVSRADIDKWQNVYEVIEGLINDLDPVLLGYLYEGYDNDLDKLFKDLSKETYRSLYGHDKTGVKPTLKYITELNSELEEQMRYNSLTYFNSNVIGMEINWHHVEWGWLVENFPLIAILAARDHGKSYYFSNGYPLWMAYRYDRYSTLKGRLNGRLGYIFSNTQTQSVNLLDIVRDTVEEIDLLREKLYPKFRDNWSKTSVKFQNGCRLRVKGMNTTVRGAHPGYIVLDDVLRDNVLYSKIQRDKSKDYFTSALLGMLIPGGQMIVVGTPFHRADLYSIFEKSIDFVYRKYPAIDKHGNVLWGSRHSKADLDMRKRVAGNMVFTREYLVDPISEDTAMFPEKILKRALVGMQGYSYVENIEAFPIKFKRVVTGGDFAYSARVGADWTCFGTWGIDDLENFWLLNMYHAKGVGYSEQKRALRSIWRRFRPDVIYLEANQFQAIYSETLKEETSMPVYPFVTTTKKHSLSEGVPSLAILFENGKIRLPYSTEKDIKITEKVLDEFRNVGWTEKGVEGIGEHDDIVMMTWIARNAYLKGGSGFSFDFI